MKIVMLAAVLALVGCSGTVQGFRQDVADSREDLRARTPYEKSVRNWSVIPGGGWVYECNDQRGPCEHAVSPGVAYFLATAGAVWALVNGARHGDKGQMAAASAAGLTLRFNDVRWAMRGAKKSEKEEKH